MISDSNGIVLNYPPIFTEGMIYLFTNSNTKSSLNCEFFGCSRIDGELIFGVDDYTQSGSLIDYTVLRYSIDRVSLIGRATLGDHLPKYANFDKNRDKLFKYLCEIFNITTSDVLDDESYKAILRDINIDILLKREVN